MNFNESSIIRRGALLAINLLFLTVWGFAGISKLFSGMPPWFNDRFGKTILSQFPGLTASFWFLALAELLAFTLAAVALVRGEFLERLRPKFLPLALVWSLFVFVQLTFGQWLTSDFTGGFQLFLYFCGTLVTLQFVTHAPGS